MKAVSNLFEAAHEFTSVDLKYEVSHFLFLHITIHYTLAFEPYRINNPPV